MGVTELTDGSWSEVVDAAGLPVLVDFWAPWCVPCKKVAPVVAGLAERHEGRLAVGSLNVDEHPAAAARFDVLSLPTLIVFKGGAPVERLHGAVSEKKIEKALAQHLGEAP